MAEHKDIFEQQEHELVKEIDLAEETEIQEPTQKQPISLFVVFVGVLLFLAILVGLLYTQEWINPQQQKGADALAQGDTTIKVLKGLNSTKDLPDVDADSWELILVGPNNIKEELSPELEEVSGTGILVDKRIVEATTNFLLAAQETIDPSIHLITGYRSLEDQSYYYESFLAEEMTARELSREAAEAYVQAYFQAPGTSEHMTGLAVDMSTVDYLNAMDPTVASQLAALAPDYGFVLRYKESYRPQTGVTAEDWHFRYVGTESARYMTDYDMPLETYLTQLKNR